MWRPGVIPGSHTSWWMKCPGLMFWAAMPSMYWSCLFHDEHWKCVSVKGRPGVILGSLCSFSESTAFEFHTMHFLYRIFDLGSFAATCYGTRQLNVNYVGVPALDHVAGWCSWLLPCLRAPGHMLHEAAWRNQSTLPALEPGVLMTRACTLAAMGSKCPAHQRDPYPGYMNAMRLFMMALQPVQAHYVKHVLISACPGPTGDVARPFGLELTVSVDVHAVGHSAGSYGAMALAAVLEEPAFSQTEGTTKVTAIAMPESLLTRRYRRQVKLVHFEKDELCVWRRGGVWVPGGLRPVF